MICDPCKRGIHEGGGHGHLMHAPEGDYMVFPVEDVEVCKGDTWCDCQHRKTVERVPR